MIIRKPDLKLVPENSKFLSVIPQDYDFSDEDGDMFANVLYERMKELKGIGLSANQVGVNARVFVMGIDDMRIDVFNPKIVSYSKETVYADEGCLSFPGIYISVKRPSEIEVEYQSSKGDTIKTKLTGLTARIFQHEYDHMEGRTMKDAVSRIKWDMAVKKFVKKNKKIIRKYAAMNLKDISNNLRG